MADVGIRGSQEEAPKTVNLTNTAQAKLKELLEREKGQQQVDELYFRFGVKPGGCSGFVYEMFFDTEKNEDDEEIVFDNGVVVLIDPETAPNVRGSEIDYEDSLQKQGFSVNNPNVSRGCGCGKSFS